MTRRVIQTPSDVVGLMGLLLAHPLPMTVSWVEGAKRTDRQNALQRRWIDEIARHLGDQKPEQVRGFCKLHFGVPIRRRDCEDFRATYDAKVKPLAYEFKLDLMQEPLDLPITRDMTTAQKGEYLDAMGDYWRGQGATLTDPEAMKWE